jgi:murein L,D-transpeptidase YcbB/YkuD
MTESGLRQWQHPHNLQPTGVIDHATLQFMNISPTAAAANPAGGPNP